MQIKVNASTKQQIMSYMPESVSPQSLNRTDKQKTYWTLEINSGINYVIHNINLLLLNISWTLHVTDVFAHKLTIVLFVLALMLCIPTLNCSVFVEIF